MNELDVLFIIGVELLFLFAFSALGRAYVYGSVVVNLALVTLMGSKLVELFGVTTNVGNVFYAGVFIATYILFEQVTAREARTVLGVGFLCVLMFTVLGQLAVGMQSAPHSDVFNAALQVVFNTSLRISFASLLAFVVAQTINMWIYQTLQERAAPLWQRIGLASLAAQAIDSMLFFGIAFAGLVSLPLLVISMVAGFLLKLFVTALSVPLVYFFCCRVR